MCWPLGKAPKVVIPTEVSDLRELSWNEDALGMEGLVGQGKKLIFFLPSCCVPECKHSLSLVSFSSCYKRETVAEREG